MSFEAYDRLNIGDKVLCRFGGNGTQVARVVKVTKAGNRWVEKYRAASDSFTRSVRLWRVDFIRRLDDAEFGARIDRRTKGKNHG